MLGALVDGVFPAGAAVAYGEVGVGVAELFPEERELVARAVHKRQREFAGGRACARRVLAALGAPVGPLLVGADREPLWPEGVVGSISHDARFCVAVGGRADAYAGIGVDLEPDEALTPEVAERIWSPGEAAHATASGVVPLASAAKLVFSAKEAVYKCQFPLTRSYIGFLGVEVTLGPGSFEASLVAPVGSLERGFSFSGRWRREAGEILTAVWVRPR